MRSVENAECRKCGVWKMRSVKEKYIKRLKKVKRKNKVISPHVLNYIRCHILYSSPCPLYRPWKGRTTLNKMKNHKIYFYAYFKNREIKYS